MLGYFARMQLLFKLRYPLNSFICNYMCKFRSRNPLNSLIRNCIYISLGPEGLRKPDIILKLVIRCYYELNCSVDRGLLC